MAKKEEQGIFINKTDKPLLKKKQFSFLVHRLALKLHNSEAMDEILALSNDYTLYFYSCSL